MKAASCLTGFTIAVLVFAAPLLSGCAPGANPTVDEAVPSAQPESATSATAEPEPSIVFLAGDLRIEAGSCTTLEWQVQGALRAYLDGKGIDPIGSESVCPTETTTYTVKAALPNGTEIERALVVVVPQTEEPTAPPTAPGPTAVPPTRVSVTPTLTTTPTVTASPVSIEFYPDHNNYEIEKGDKCTAVVWRTSGVTDLQLEREGMGRKDVGASGREEVCFETGKITLFLFYKTPDGKEERAEVLIRRKS